MIERTVAWTPGTSRAIVTALRERVRAAASRRGDRVDEHIGEHWISWRSRKRDRVFAEIRPLRGRIQVFILPRPRDLQDHGGLAERAPRTQGWGWFRSRLEVSSMERVGPAARLIVQSYERVIHPDNDGRRARGAGRTQGL